MKSFIYSIENEIDEVREGAVTDDENEIADIIEQLSDLVDALREDALDVDMTWNDVYDDVHVILVCNGLERVMILDMNGDDDAWLSLIRDDGEVAMFERGAFGGYYEINDAQTRFTILLESGF